jgi:hypothetical protein
MTRYRESPRRAIAIEQELRCYPPDARDLFLGNPQGWLPGTMTMRGSSTFHARMQLYGVSLKLQFRVGMPWTRGTSTTRHLRVEYLDPPPGVAWILPAVDGDLNLLGEQRLRLRFGGATVGARLPGRRLSALRMMCAVTAGIAARLSADTPSLPRSSV